MEAATGTAVLKTAPGFEFAMTRFFAARRETVFRMMIDPILIPRWWGPKRSRTIVDYMDVRPGGGWRFVQHDDEGNEFGFHGVYEEVDFPNRLVYSFEYEGTLSQNRIETVVFEEVGEKTQATFTYVFDAQQARDAALAAGMLEDFAASMDRFAQLLGEQPGEAKTPPAASETTVCAKVSEVNP